ncbi:MAG: family hydrolase [Clostridiaceae bacterium]|jgi:Cof subfamily protein (haloacid dehalogenase superfamily)|nr:family hydrolase [Clostridiaceae bacterium]
MDGTLLDGENNISERNKNAIKKAVAKGVKVAICTGRVFTSAYYYSDILEIKTPIIASNGAYIREKDRDEVIYKNVLSIAQCKKLVPILKNNNLYFHFNTSGGLLTEKILYSSEFYAKANKSLPENMQIKIHVIDDWEKTFEQYDGEIVKCITVDKDNVKLNKVKNEIINLGEFEVVSSWSNNFEIMNKSVSKGHAVEVLANYYDIDKESIVCIGDSENDLSMIKLAGLGIAMGNAPDYVKNQADYITDTNSNHGVAKAIEKFILNE